MEAATVPCTCPTCGSPFMVEKPRVDLNQNTFICAAGHIRVTPIQAEILAAILERYPENASNDYILSRIYNGVGEPDNAEHTLRVHAYGIRRRLRGLGWTVRGNWGRGYRLERIEA